MNEEELNSWTCRRVLDVQNHFRRLTPEQRLEYFDAIAAQVVIACADLDDTEWPADLHLADVIEKHLVRLIPREPCEQSPQ